MSACIIARTLPLTPPLLLPFMCVARLFFFFLPFFPLLPLLYCSCDACRHLVVVVVNHCAPLFLEASLTTFSLSSLIMRHRHYCCCCHCCCCVARQRVNVIFIRSHVTVTVNVDESERRALVSIGGCHIDPHTHTHETFYRLSVCVSLSRRQRESETLAGLSGDAVGSGSWIGILA